VNGLLAGAASLLLLPVLVIAAAMGGEPAQPSTAALADIPATYLTLYQQAGVEFGLPWELLAAVGKVESDHGRNPAAYEANAAGAVGPMQFEPATFAAYDWAAGHLDPSIDDPHDAIFAAAAMLRADGAPDETQAALYAYNHADWYVSEVLAWAAAYTSAAAVGANGELAAGGAPAATTAARYALSQLGTPYLWGGESPAGFDCSGLVQAAYEQAGITLPRVAQDQYDAGPPVPDGQPLDPGDLVFFGTDRSHVDHVGIVINESEMVDAPHTGALVRTEPFDWPDYLGATRPAG
jgi:cell wall-associated NlpC family hydrolase